VLVVLSACWSSSESEGGSGAAGVTGAAAGGGGGSSGSTDGAAGATGDGSAGFSGAGGVAGTSGVPCDFAQDFTFTLPEGGGFRYFGYLRKQHSSSVDLFMMRMGSDVSVGCSAPFSACGTPDAIDASEIVADIAAADVQLALRTSPFPVYGERSASSDPTFRFMDLKGGPSGGFSVIAGHQCPIATATCEPTPAGVTRLMTDLTAFVSAASPLCTWR
jgi:hypothetical protein